MTTEIAALLGALGGSLIGGLLVLLSAYITNRHNREVTLKAALKTAVAPMNYDWIKDLRECVAKVMVGLREGSEISMDDHLFHLTKLELMLNKKHELLAAKLMRCSRLMKDSQSKKGEKHLEAMDLYNECMEDCKTLAKNEWDRIQEILIFQI